jgi:chromosome segregation ATPase
MGETGAVGPRTASGWEEWRDQEIWDYTEEIKLHAFQNMKMLESQLQNQVGMMQQLWERVGDRQEKLHQDAHQEHDWVEKQVNGLRGSMEKHFATMVARIEGFTQELKAAWTLQQSHVQQALGMISGADQAAERVAKLENQLQEAVQKWNQPLTEVGRMDRMEKMLVDLNRKAQVHDEVLEGAKKAMDGWSANQNQCVDKVVKLQQEMTRLVTEMTWKEHDHQKSLDLATEREKNLRGVLQEEVTARVQERQEIHHCWPR